MQCRHYHCSIKLEFDSIYATLTFFTFLCRQFDYLLKLWYFASHCACIQWRKFLIFLSIQLLKICVWFSSFRLFPFSVISNITFVFSNLWTFLFTSTSYLNVMLWPKPINVISVEIYVERCAHLILILF